MLLSMVLGDLSVWDIIIRVILLLVGIVLLVKGSDIFVSSASSIARKLKVSSLVIGLTIVAFGTSAPEFAVSFTSSLNVKPGETADIAIGNVVGSNIANVLLVLGFSSVVAPMLVKKTLLKRELPFLIVVSSLFAVFSLDVFLDGATSNRIIRSEAIVFLFFMAFYVYSSIKNAKQDAKIEIESTNLTNTSSEPEKKEMNIWLSILLLVLGIAGIVVGANFVTDSAKTLAINIGVACNVDKSLMTTLVGLTIVAVGTSLPELVTSIVAAKRGENDLALGNVIGSNIFNILLILGLSGVVSPLGMNNSIIIDILFCLGVTILLFIYGYKGKIKKWQGYTFILLYVCYIAYIVLRVFI